ncbi:PREDICTED: nucleolar protein 6 [Tarenaya hassleriana]|uniref:nucleolar protein 6 n=1 Tax=Tarenaya hassleriana TaxID=28532 RepID=UPI00053CA29E|nr:PREDICTED: nucleolar protein 6 [Tarenaya hassleriana]XP_010533808.1 PREDICTED: nucleolar protein 6 [Tarenaya hassleriana]
MELDTAAFSDSLDFKVNELLKDVRLDYVPSFTELVDGVVESIKDAIAKIPEDLKVGSDLAPGFIRDIRTDKVEFNFKKPKPNDFKLCGSHSIHSMAKPDSNVDLLVRLPKECFYEKDYMNHRYHAKRCLYLCVIRKYLLLSSSFAKVEWSTLQNEARKPILVVFPAKKLVEVPGFSVRIIPAATSLFNVAKLSLNRNNVRSASHEGVSQPTPTYNSSVLEDMFLEENSEFLKKTFSGWKELGDALVLLKIWVRQRSSIYAHDCLNGFLISMILAYIANHDKITKSLKALEIFRVTLDFIATSKLWERGLYFPPQNEKSVSKEEKAQFRQSFPVVLCDSSSHVNLAFRMSSVGFQELQDEAALTLKCMGKSRDGGFEDIFMTKIDYLVKYDYCIRLNLKGKTTVYTSGFCLDKECWRMYEQKVHSLLHQGLSDRAKLIRVVWKNTHLDWHIENGLSGLDTEALFVGISVSSVEKAFRMVDIGPNAENKIESLKFRKFWGEKAELRRFKDGRIAESTVWETHHWTRHLIMKQIIDYVFRRHLSLSSEDIVQIVDQLDFSLISGDKDPISLSGSLLGAFDVLSKCLREIEDIPLKVSSVQPLDSALRFTSVFPPEPHPVANEKVDARRLHKLTPSCIPAMEVMIQLEGSGNWPMDDLAIEKTKSAFLLKIAESLQNSEGIPSTATEDDVDVFMGGYAFRLRILHERGLNLVKRESGADPMKGIQSTDKMLFLRSQHASMINGLQGRFPIYAPVVRFAKRWVASHLFSACLMEEAVELLVAHVFLKPLPLGVPCSRVNGFLRFLRLLADYDWMFCPLIVDINDDLSRNDEKEINDNFMSSRKGYEEDKQNISSAMFLATSYDKASEAWTRNSPNSLELKRLVAYARSSANLLSKLVLHEQNDSVRWECLFRTPLNNYDAVVLLHRDRLPYPQRLLFPSELNQGKHVARGKASNAFHPFLLHRDSKRSPGELKDKLMVNFEPTECFVRELQKEIKTLKPWYDHIGGDVIGLTWEKPNSKKREREEEGEEEGRNPEEKLKQVGEIGKGMVRDVYLLKPPRLA